MTTPRTVLSIDVSGSVEGSDLYWARVKSEFDALANVPNLDILVWSTTCCKISRDTLVKYIAARKGHGGGTSPICMVENFCGDSIDQLIFITDGEICASDVAVCDKSMTNVRRNIKSVACHIINHNPNVSVTTPFTRGIDATVTTHTSTSSEQVFCVTSSDYAMLDSLDSVTLATFSERHKSLTDALLAITIGTTGLPRLVDKVIELKRRLTAEFARQQPINATLTDALDSGDTAAAVAKAQHIINDYYIGGEAKDLQVKLDRLVMLAQRGSQSFSVSQFNHAGVDRAPHAATVEPETAIDCELSATSIAFECPIALDNDAPVIVVVEGEPVLAGLPKETIEAIIRNPLSILGNGEVCLRLKARVKHAIGFGAFMHLKKEPYTSEPIAGCIPLDPCKEHMAVTDSALFNLFVGGKQIGNVDLYFAVLWLLDIPWLVEVKPQLTAQMAERLRTHQSSLSLTGMTNMVTTRMSLGTAVWFVLASSIMQIDNDVRPIRTHAFVSTALMQMAELAGYATTPEMATAVRLTRLLLQSLAACKRDHKAFSDSCRALYHNHLVISDKPVFLDCNVEFNRGYDIVGEFTVAERAYIATLVNPSLSAAKINTPTSAEVDAWWLAVGSRPVVNWASGLEPIQHLPIYVHPGTCRPLFNVTVKGTAAEWSDAYAAHFGHTVENNKILSGNKAIGQWVCEHLVWPTTDDLLVELYDRECRVCATNPTLQVNAQSAIESTLADYTEIFRTLTPAEFKHRFKRSVSRVDRAQIEKVAV